MAGVGTVARHGRGHLDIIDAIADGPEGLQRLTATLRLTKSLKAGVGATFRTMSCSWLPT